jgi:hypothetical protein
MPQRFYEEFMFRSGSLSMRSDIFFSFFFLWLDSPIWVWAFSFRRGFMVTHIRHTTIGRTPLDEGPARRRDLYLTTQYSQETDIHALGGIRAHDPSKRAAVDPRLRPHGHWDRLPSIYLLLICKTKTRTHITLQVH